MKAHLWFISSSITALLNAERFAAREPRQILRISGSLIMNPLRSGDGISFLGDDRHATDASRSLGIADGCWAPI